MIKNKINLEEGLKYVNGILNSNYFNDYLLKKSKLISNMFEVSTTAWKGKNSEEVYLRDVSPMLKKLIPFTKKDRLLSLSLELNANEDLIRKTKFCEEMLEEGIEGFPLIISAELSKNVLVENRYQFYLTPKSVYFEQDDLKDEEDYKKNKRRFNDWTKDVMSEFGKILNSS